MEREELGYSGGRPVWYIILIIIAMILIILGYGYKNFLPDLNRWLAGGNPDTIQWAGEIDKK